MGEILKPAEESGNPCKTNIKFWIQIYQWCTHMTWVCVGYAVIPVASCRARPLLCQMGACNLNWWPEGSTTRTVLLPGSWSPSTRMVPNTFSTMILYLLKLSALRHTTCESSGITVASWDKTPQRICRNKKPLETSPRIWSGKLELAQLAVMVCVKFRHGWVTTLNQTGMQSSCQWNFAQC